MKRIGWIYVVLFLCSAGVLYSIPIIQSAASGEANYTIKPAVIGEQIVALYVADSEGKRVDGLSKHEELEEDYGMVFYFDSPAHHKIWMKDMNFPIDILWFDRKLNLIHIEENVPPDSFPETFSSEEPALYVVEVNAGFVDANDIKLGDKLFIH